MAHNHEVVESISHPCYHKQDHEFARPPAENGASYEDRKLAFVLE